MARPTPPIPRSAPALHALICSVPNVRIKALFHRGAFDPESTCVENLRKLIGIATFIRAEHSVAPTRQRIREALARTQTRAVALRRKLAASLYENVPASTTKRFRDSLAALDTYTIEAIEAAYERALVVRMLPDRQPIDLASAVAALTPYEEVRRRRSKDLDLVIPGLRLQHKESIRKRQALDRESVLAALDAFVATLQAASISESRSTSARDRMADRHFLGRGLATLHIQYPRAFKSPLREFIAEVLALAGLHFPDPRTSQTAFDRALLGKAWLRYCSGRGLPPKTVSSGHRSPKIA